MIKFKHPYSVSEHDAEDGAELWQCFWSEGWWHWCCLCWWLLL